MVNKWIIQFFSYSNGGTFEEVFNTEEECNDAFGKILRCQAKVDTTKEQLFWQYVISDDYGQSFSCNLMNYLVTKTSLDAIAKNQAEMRAAQLEVQEFYDLDKPTGFHTPPSRRTAQ